MKKLVILAACLSIWACTKESTLTPDPLPEPEVTVPVEDTSKHNILNNWNNYQYKYTHEGNLWITQTDWNVRITKDTIKFDEGRDGDFEKQYPITIQASPQVSIMTIVYPGSTVKNYEIRATRVGKKQGYDLVNLIEAERDVYSLIK